MQPWVLDETKSADFGDERLDRRYSLLLDRLGDKPSLSIPAACGGTSETEAAYRFFDNERVSADLVLRPHRDATLDRIRTQAVVLIAQDTTELDLTRRQEKVGGPLNDESRWGLFAHPHLALTPQRVPLGVIGATIWSRNAEDFARSAAEKRRRRKASPIEQKESYRWVEGYRHACAVAEGVPTTRVVSISDSEGDIYECFVEGSPAEGRKAEWIVRAAQDRALSGGEGELRQSLSSRLALESRTIAVSARRASTGNGRKRNRARAARQATVSVRAMAVTLRPPHRPGVQLPEVTVNAVLVREDHPPAGEEPIEWLLLTSLPIAAITEVRTVIEYYCTRWEIEVYFRVLKGGCRVEDLQLETTERFEACLAMYMIVAWRVLYVLMVGRAYPEVRCDRVLSEAEWKSVYQIVTNRPLPAQPPTLGEILPLVAQLGGYLGRKNDGPPGPKTLWIGLQRMRDFAIAWTRFGPPPTTAKDV
jgi:hypothetical protein